MSEQGYLNFLLKKQFFFLEIIKDFDFQGLYGLLLFAEIIFCLGNEELKQLAIVRKKMKEGSLLISI